MIKIESIEKYFIKNKVISMIEKIKTEISKEYSLEEKRWIFLSCFDKNNILLLSNGVLTTNKSLWIVIDMLYHGILEAKKTDIIRIVCDIVTETQLLQNMEDINTVDIISSGISVSTIDYTKSGVILPWTVGISSLSQLLQIIKEKNHIEGNVVMYSFQSKKIEIIIQ